MDLARSKYNYHLIQSEESYREKIDRHIQEAGCRTRKDNIRFIDTLITASPEFFEGKNRKEIREFLQHLHEPGGWQAEYRLCDRTHE